MFKISKKMVLIVFLVSTSLISCEKKEVIKKEDVSSLEEAERVRAQKIERFISIVWEVDRNQIVFDAKESSYSFKGLKVSKTEIERLYDLSNEYKLVYETN